MIGCLIAIISGGSHDCCSGGANAYPKRPQNYPCPKPTREVNQRKPKAIHAIDVDVHHQFDKPEVLFPYLPRQYVEYIKDFGTMMPGIEPAPTCRAAACAFHDLWDGKDINPSTDPDVLIERHIDKYDLELAVLTGGPYAAAVHPDPDYAAAYCHAFNEWTLAQWVAKDKRIRASIHIAAGSAVGSRRD